MTGPTDGWPEADRVTLLSAQLRDRADRAVGSALRAYAEDATSPAEVVARLNELTAILHNDLEYYRRTLIQVVGDRRRGRHLSAVQAPR